MIVKLVVVLLTKISLQVVSHVSSLYAPTTAGPLAKKPGTGSSKVSFMNFICYFSSLFFRFEFKGHVSDIWLVN